MTDPARIAAFLRALGQDVPPAAVAAVVDLLCGRPAPGRPAGTIPVVLWRSGQRVSSPDAWIVDPPPPVVSVGGSRLFRTLDEVVTHLTAEPETETYVLQYVRQEPRAAVYVHEAEVAAMMEGA